LRTVEVSRANVDDLKTNGRLLLWIWSKGHSEADEVAVIPVDQERVIRAWLAERAKMESKDNALFLSLSHRTYGTRLSTRAIHEMVTKRFEQAGIRDPLKTPHSLRHSAITNLINHNASILQVQAFARHKTLNTALVYIHEVNRLAAPPEDLISY